MIFVEENKIHLGHLALANAGAMAADYVSLKNYNHVAVIVGLAPASGTDVTAITMVQATDVAAGGEKALSFTTKVWKNAAALTGDTLVRTTYASSIGSSAVAATELFVIEIDASELDVANNFDCLAARLTDPGSVSTPAFVLYVLSEPRFKSALPPSAIID